MKLKNYYYFILAFLSVGIFFACDDDKDKETVYPRVIETKDVLVNDESITFTSFIVHDRDSLRIIKSDHELFEFWHTRFGPDYEGDIVRLPTSLESNVDYEKFSVLLANGGSGGVTKIEKSYIQEADKKYVLKIKVYLDGTELLQLWTQVFAVPRIDSDMEIAYEVEYVDTFSDRI